MRRHFHIGRPPSERLVGQEAHALHAETAGRRKYNLPTDYRLVLAMHIHADVDIVHEVTPAGYLKLLAGLVAVHAPYNDLTFTERFRVLLPLAREAANAGLPLQAKDGHLREVEFRRLGKTVGKGRADEPVSEVR